jgi:hypothetical protein
MFNVAILGGANVDGSKAEPGERVLSLSLLGGANLDFASKPPPPEVSIVAIAILGGINIRVRPEQEVKLSGFSLLGSRGVSPPRGNPDEFALPLEVTAYSLLGSVNVNRPNGEASGDVG